LTRVFEFCECRQRIVQAVENPHRADDLSQKVPV
jgi:hypothetical protein